MFLKHKPTDNIPPDLQGAPINRGCRVAFNRSGNVVPGRVLDVQGEWTFEYGGYFWSGHFKVQSELHPKDKPSRVKNPESILVLSQT